MEGLVGLTRRRIIPIVLVVTNYKHLQNEVVLDEEIAKIGKGDAAGRGEGGTFRARGGHLRTRCRKHQEESCGSGSRRVSDIVQETVQEPMVCRLFWRPTMPRSARPRPAAFPGQALALVSSPMPAEAPVAPVSGTSQLRGHRQQCVLRTGGAGRHTVGPAQRAAGHRRARRLGLRQIIGGARRRHPRPSPLRGRAARAMVRRRLQARPASGGRVVRRVVAADLLRPRAEPAQRWRGAPPPRSASPASCVTA